jgi:hypothetical protein
MDVVSDTNGSHYRKRASPRRSETTRYKRIHKISRLQAIIELFHMNTKCLVRGCPNPSKYVYLIWEVETIDGESIKYDKNRPGVSSRCKQCLHHPISHLVGIPKVKKYRIYNLRTRKLSKFIYS